MTNSPLTRFSRALKAEIDARRGETKRGKPTQEEIAAAIGRTQPYVSSRINGDFPWTTNDLDGIARLFGDDAFSLVAAARRRAVATDKSPTDVDNVIPLRSDVGGLPDDRYAVARPADPDSGEDQ